MVADATDARIVVVEIPVIRAAVDTAQIGDLLGIVGVEIAHRESILAVDYVVPIAQVLMLRKPGRVGQNDFCANCASGSACRRAPRACDGGAAGNVISAVCILLLEQCDGYRTDVRSGRVNLHASRLGHATIDSIRTKVRGQRLLEGSRVRAVPARENGKLKGNRRTLAARPFFCESSWKEPKKKSLSFLMGPPNTPPNWFWSSTCRLFCCTPFSTWVFSLRKNSLASRTVLRKNSNTSP